MKFFLAVFLCGVACCLAHPRCSGEEREKCSGGASDAAPETEKEMNEYCRMVDCYDGYYDRCPDKEFEPMPKIFKKILSTVCDKTNPLRRKYLDNAKCLNNAMKEIMSKCAGSSSVPRDADHETQCREMAAFYDCAKEHITSTCNQESTDVFTHVYPMLDFYGC